MKWMLLVLLIVSFAVLWAAFCAVIKGLVKPDGREDL